MDMNMVRRDTGLPHVEHLAGDNPPRRHFQVGILVHDGRALAAQLQSDLGEMLRCCRHDDTADTGTAGKENMIKALFKQHIGHFGAALEYRHAFIAEAFLHHFLNHIRHGGVQ